MKYYIGIDNGGTTTKAALYDKDGCELCVSSCATDMIAPQADFCERDMEDMWEANCSVIREILEKSKIDPSDVSAVACCGHGKGVYLWGKDNCPVGNGIISTDNRAWEYPVRWEKDGTAKKLYKYTCQSIMSCQPVALLAWIRDNKPGMLDEIKYIFSCKDYVRFRLTGVANGELTDSSGTNLLNLHTRDYDKRILELLGLEMLWDCLPPLKKSSDICGYVTAEVSARTGLKEGTPVAGGMFDIDACAIAVDAADTSKICMIAGTWSINEYICKQPVLDGSVRLNSLFCDPEYYLIEESSPTSAGNNQWYINNLLPEAAKEARAKGSSIYDEANSWVEPILPDEFCPIFLPFIMASNVHPNAKGSFVGISANHTRAHITRSVYEGIAFCHRYHLEKLMKSRTEPVDCIRLAGCVAHSEVWVQMFADICGIAVQTANIGETGALGCAITAAVAVGDYANYHEGAKAMVKLGKRVEPRMQWIETYNRKYKLYCKVIDSLDDTWDLIQKFVDKK
ncbi:MAG: FGGY-family carbohydrate kinase [Oscillospiraceae bacterium]